MRGGASITSTINLSNNGGQAVNPQIAASGSNVYVVWEDNTPGNFDIFLKKSDDGGSTFGSTINLSNDAGNSLIPQIAVSDFNPYVTWEDNTSGNYDALFKLSQDGGASFRSTINLSNDAGGSFVPRIAAISGSSNAYVVWQDNTPGNNDVLLNTRIS
jgi:hypothetical protein